MRIVLSNGLRLLVVALFLLSPIHPAEASEPRVRFDLTDEPGPWFKNEEPIAGTTESLAISEPGVRVEFKIGGLTETVHTITSLLWPLQSDGTNAVNMPFDQGFAHRSGGFDVDLETPGLYVFFCNVHPYMFAAVIVDDSATEGLDLGEEIRLFSGVTVPTDSDLAFRLLRTFFVVTDPANWQDYTAPDGWNVRLPPVEVRLAGGQVVNLSALDIVDMPLTLSEPPRPGVGQVWVDTQFEIAADKEKFGSATALDTSTWQVTRKVTMPEDELNHPHNMWVDRLQEVIYQTQWFDSKLAVFERATGAPIANMTVGDAPSHVMTSPVDDTIYVALNGSNDNDAVVEIDPVTLNKTDDLDIGSPHPHGHWISADGSAMVTPNQFTDDSSILDLGTGAAQVVDLGINEHGHPLATGMMPDGSKYYVANFLDNSLSVVDTQSGTPLKTINLLTNYDPLTGAVTGPVGGLPIQTPVSPDGRFVVTANVLLPSITVIDTRTDAVVLHIPCDAGCHGVQFGAQAGRGYYAYVSNKFSNALIVFDPVRAVRADRKGNNDGILDASEAEGVVGRVLLATANAAPGFETDSAIVGHDGMGGQGTLAIPNVYNGWIQATVNAFPSLSAEIQGYVCALSRRQRDPDGPAGIDLTPPPCP